MTELLGSHLNDMLQTLSSHLNNLEQAIVLESVDSDEIQELKLQLSDQVDELERGIRVFADQIAMETSALEKAEDAMLSLEVQYSHLNYIASQMSNLHPKHPPLPTANTVPVSRRVPPSERPIPIIALLTRQEYEAIPKYLLGRTTMERINDSIAEFNKYLVEKYTVLKTPQKTLLRQDRDRVVEWRDQETKDTIGKVFVTEQDIKNNVPKSTFRMDPHGRAVLSFLRHLGKIKEVRGGNHVRFVVQPY